MSGSSREKGARGGRGGDGRAGGGYGGGGRTEVRKSDERTKEILRLRKKVVDKIGKGRDAMKKLMGAFMSFDTKDESRVSEREFSSVMKKVGVGGLQRNDLKALFTKFEDEEGLFMWEDFIQFCFTPEKSVGRGRQNNDDDSYDDEDPNRRVSVHRCV